MPSPNEDNPNSAKAIVFFLIALIALGSFVASFYIFRSIVDTPPDSNVEIPEPNIPPLTGSGASSSVSSVVTTTSLPLLKDFIASQNPFNETEYNKMPRIIYSGTFKSVNANVKGTVVGNEEILLMFNFGQETGIINGIRTSTKRVNIQGTRKLGGIFPPASIFSASVNLLSDRLGSSSSNIGKCNEGVCTFNFIADKGMAQVAPIVVIPVTLNGSFGGAIINELSLAYECKEIGKCKIQVCTSGQPAYECIKEKYNKDEAEMWYQDYLKNQH